MTEHALLRRIKELEERNKQLREALELCRDAADEPSNLSLEARLGRISFHAHAALVREPQR